MDGVQLRPPEPGARPNRNPNLDSFEAVMMAMDTELGRVRQNRRPSPNAKMATGLASVSKAASSSSVATNKGKGKQKATVEDTMDEDGSVFGADMDLDDQDVDGLMDDELRAALIADGDGEGAADDGGGEGGAMDYNLIRNFLESFKSQGGLPGPVSTLAGRLQPGWTLPRDEV